MNQLIAFTILVSIIFSTLVGYTNQQGNINSNSFHTHEEHDHHSISSEEVIAAPFMEDEQEEHAHEHQHDPDSPSHQHSHSHGHSHGNAPTSIIAWMPTDSPKVSGVSHDSGQIKPTEENSPEDPYLSSIFRPPIFA